MKATFFLQRVMASNSLIWGYTSWHFNRTPRRLLKITLLLMALLFCGNVGAETAIYDWTTQSGTSGNIDENISFTTEKNSSQSAPAYNDEGELRLYFANNGNGCSITLHTSNNAIITDVTIKASSQSYTPTVKYNIDGGNDIEASLSGITYSISNISAIQSLKIRNANTSNKQWRIKSITVTYTAPTPTESYTVTFNTGTGACETSSLTESNPGAGVILPTAISPCPSNWTFVGWSTTEITAETATAPQLYAEGSTYHPMANETLYAVYKKGTGEFSTTEYQFAPTSTIAATSTPTLPEGASIAFKNTYTQTKEQMTAGNSQTWTIKGVPGFLTAVKASMKTNAKSGNGNVSIKVNDTQVFSLSSYKSTYGNSGTYTEKDFQLTLQESGNVEININATVNSLYCNYIKATFSIENNLYSSNPDCSVVDIATPTFSPESGTYYETQNVAISCVTPNTYIYYTIDGTNPLESATAVEYTGSSIVVDRSVTLKAVAMDDNLDFSDIATATYVIKPNTPTFSLESGTYYGSQSVDIICATEDVSIYYTTNGDEPSSSSTLYTGTLTIASTTTLKAVAIKNGESSEVSSVTYTIEMPQLLPPVATEATDITNTSFTANWDAVTDATDYIVNVWTEGDVQETEAGNQNLTGWDYNVDGTYSTSGNYGKASPSIKFAETNNYIKTRTYNSPITEFSFWYKGQGDDLTSTLLIEGYNGSEWRQIDNIITLPTKGTIKVYNELVEDFYQIKFTFTKESGNLAIDDITIVPQPEDNIPGSPFTVSSGTSLNVTGLSFDTKYCYNVVAKADGYVDSDVSNTICTTTSNTSCALATPVVTATPTTSAIYLQWSPVDGATSYIVSLNAETPQTVTGTSYTFTSLTPSTSYNWSVAASSDECTGIAATGATATLEQPTVAGVEIVEVDINGLKLDFHEQDAIATVVIDNEVTVSEGERPIADDIFFSKYFEASGTAKLLGIYNGTNDSLPLADLEIWHRTADNAKLSLVGFGGTNPNFIMPNEEIIIYNEGSADVQNCAEEQENFDKWKPANVTANHPAIQFGGKGTITLRRGNEIIDIIGALDENGSPVEGNEQPTWGDDPGFTCAGGDNIKTDEIEDDYGLSTNRCLLIRRNHVKSGATAVAQNINAFNTLCTEWGGFHIDDDKDTQDQLTCEGFGYVGGFDYQGYYTQYVQLQTTEFDDLTQNADGTYTLPIPSLHKYSCTNIKLKTLDANGEVLETIIYKVPIIVNQDVTTAAEAFFHFEGDTCKNCDVVIRDEATLTAEATGKSEFRNVEVYPQATLAVPESESLTVHSLRMRSNAVEDQMPYANIVGTLNNQTNMLYYDMRINNSAYRFFALPDTIKVGSIKFSNGMPAVSGTDFLVMYYDGEQRTTNGGLQSNWKPLSADSSIWAGNGYNIATAKAKMQELRFELEYDKVMGPDTKQVHVYDYGMNDYREGAIKPNNVGWNLVGNPYLYIYENGTGDGLVYGKLEIADDGYIWNDTENLRYITYFNDEGRTYLQDKVGRRLRPFKCFFVQVGDPANEEKGLMYVTFNKYKAHNPDRQMVLAQRTPEPSEEQYVAVQIALGDKTDKMGITIDNAYTTEYEIGRDLEKMMNYGTLPHVYAYVNNSQKLAFNAVPEWAAQSVVAGAYFPEAGEYTISLDPNDRPTNRVMAVWLTDMINNVTTNLLLGDYSFYAQRAEQKNRFMIAVELAPEISTSTLVSSADGVYAYTQQRQMTICGLAENSVVSVYDALGHLVIQRNTSDASLTEQLPAAGMYLVKVVNAQQKATLKLLAY